MSRRAGRVIREGALWGGASALVLALHLGGALWIMRQAEAAAPPGLPEPVFVDLAPAEEAAQESVAPTEEATEEPVEEAAEEPVEPEPQPEPEPEPQPEPEPEEVVEPLELPPLPQMEPLEDMAELFPPAPPELETPPEVVLNSSARPQRRPEREPEPEREPRREPEPRREARREPEPQRQAEPRRQEQPAQERQTRRVEQGQQGATGRTGASERQIARDEASWKQQVGVCLLRSASRVSGASGARSTVALVIARNGRVQSASLTSSTGDARVDREISRAMGRARCPAAPASLTSSVYRFVQPFSIQ